MSMGERMVDVLNAAGIIPDIKLNHWHNKAGISGTKVGPLWHPETMEKRLDMLKKRAAEAHTAVD